MFKQILEYYIIKKSRFFDKHFYLNSNPDVRKSGVNPIIHFISRGWKENRDPSPEFSTSWYLKTYDDVRSSGQNPLIHYIKYGRKEGRHIKKLPRSLKNKSKGFGIETVSLLIIGAQRAGTTSLYNFLDSLPVFCGSKEKEPGFFSVENRYNKGVDWYHDQFPCCYPEQIAFEATPEYLYYPFIPARVKRYNDNLRFIVLLRDPVKRCYSAWKLFRNFYPLDDHQKKNLIKESQEKERESLANLLLGERYPSFSEAVKADLERFTKNSEVLEPSFVRRGIYHTQISHWFEYFDISNFLFIEINELNDEKNLVNKLEEFLSCDLLSHINKPVMENYNRITDKDFSDSEIQAFHLLKTFYRDHNTKLFDLINKEYNWG